MPGPIGLVQVAASRPGDMLAPIRRPRCAYGTDLGFFGSGEVPPPCLHIFLTFTIDNRGRISYPIKTMDQPRKFALELGLPKYEGRPCRLGHTIRYTATGKCVLCRQAKDKRRPRRVLPEAKRRWRDKNPERVKEYARQWRNANADRVRQTRAKYYSAHPKSYDPVKAKQGYLRNREKYIARAKAYKKRMTPQQRRAAKRAEYHSNPEPYARRARLRQGAMRKEQRCKCCTNKQLAEVYRFAKMLGCEVDHRVPLAAGGMHCANNLQCLTEAEHAAKTENDRKTYGWLWS